MFCPNCGAEYREGFYQCSECEVGLVDEPPEESMPLDEPLEAIFRSADRALLPVIRSVLAAAGIPCSVQGEMATAMLPVATARQLEAIVHVPQHLAEEARRLLEEVPDASLPDSGEEPQ